MMSNVERDTSPPRNADNSPDHRQHQSKSNDVAKAEETKLSEIVEQRLTGKMVSYAREIICFILAIMFTALAAFHSTPPKISKPPVAKPFFNQSSIVLDFYKGHLNAMIERITEADFSFIMYYAPWDAESQAVREEFEKVALFYNSQIFFAAINCWHPSSECRAQYNKIQSYPVLMLYPSRDSGVQYRGIRTAPYMIRFLHAFMNPIVRITCKEQLMQLFVDYYAVIVGHINFTGLASSPGYKEFYKSAVRFLERDPNRELAFALVTNTASSEADYGIVKFPSASLFMSNETLNYPDDKEWTTENILNWIANSIHQPTLWLQPPGFKSLTLAPFLREGPVFFLFTPRNPFLFENYNYNLIREIGLQYYNCADNLTVKNLMKTLHNYSYTAKIRHMEKDKYCLRLLSRNEEQKSTPTVSSSVRQWIDKNCCAKVFMNKCSLCNVKTSNTESSTCNAINNAKTAPICKKTDIFKMYSLEGRQEKYEFCCDKNSRKKDINTKRSKYKMFTHAEKMDPQSAAAIREVFMKNSCKLWLEANKYYKPIFPKDFSKHSDINLSKSLCNMNRTLAWIAIDSLHYFQLAEGLGIDILKKKDKTTAVILDVAQESAYIMQEDFSRQTLIQFINNYTKGFSERTLRSDNSRRFVQKLKNKVDCNLKNSSKICVPELTTEIFLDTILDASKDVVVMYHSPYCAFCSAISYVYLTVAHYLSKMDHLRFVRIDGDNNDLPWEYSMDRFPSILFFPAKRKEDSTVFPFSLPINISNLLHYVLVNLNVDSRVEALTNICALSVSDPPDKCIVRIRWLCLEIIEGLLRDHRKLRRHLNFLDRRTARIRNKVILLKLEHIRYIHLILGSTVDLTKDQHLVCLIQKRFRRYYRTLESLELDKKFNTNDKKIVQKRVIQTVNITKAKTSRTEL